MKYKPYPKYKSSGVDWIGNIPEGWEVIRSRYIFSSLSGNGFSVDLQGRGEGLYPFYKVSDINADATYVNESNNYVGRDDVMENRWTLIPKGSILFAKIGEALKKNHRKITLKDCLIDNNMMALYLKQSGRYDIKFLYYVLKIVDMVWFVNPGTIPSLDVNKWKNFYIPDINFAIQQHIADFLDQKTSQIDDLIQKKEEMIKLLKEKRAAIINQAVTKGLDPNAKMKPSGIDWIGDIPEGWDVRRLKFIASTKFSNVDKHSKEEEQPVNLCNYVDVYYNDFIDSNMDFMQATATNDEIRKFALNKGDVIVTKDSESWDDIAIPAYVKEDMRDVLCGYHLAIIQANQNMCGEYIFWSFLSQIINYQFQVSATGVTRYGLGKGSLDNAIFFAPSKKEQHQIAKYLNQKTTEIDGLINKIESAIAKLREYRSSLITAAVTGKIDVRG